ncbi:Mannitol dehydrogenase rossman domain family [Chondrus crispus]|uniref:Mannitol dehydrogenase rossman domain family n=1 Tax=Chondrus crispus TaxID=2769 RepID=R7QP50_CHOCR|nr:Mannitol dehydrogenase rossman domain family [Chondrus crispus]CDF39165.1 Mannitol dehydrogenase rossman domain family [Chondrus crispus]|eukprot:XP_005719076.1 Mannitol dehydrogenase rossman domain family [Chondrus crispus]
MSGLPFMQQDGTDLMSLFSVPMNKSLKDVVEIQGSSACVFPQRVFFSPSKSFLSSTSTLVFFRRKTTSRRRRTPSRRVQVLVNGASRAVRPHLIQPSRKDFDKRFILRQLPVHGLLRKPRGRLRLAPLCDVRQLRPQGIVVLKHLPALTRAIAVAAPQGADEREAVDAAAGGAPAADTRDDELGLATGAVEAEAGDGVVHGGVCEAGGDGLEVSAGGLCGGVGHVREDLARLDLAQEGDEAGVGHGGVCKAVAEEGGGVGDGGVAGVEDGELHALEGGDVGDEAGADGLERRAGVGREGGVLQQPLREGLGHDGGGVGDGEAVAHEADVGGGGGRGDAVDHGAREADAVADPGGERGVDAVGEGEDGGAGGAAVGGEVVAGEDGEGRETIAAAVAEGGEEEAEDGGGRGGGVVARDVEVGSGGGGVVSALGDGQGEDADGGVGQGAEDGGRGGGKVGEDRGDDGGGGGGRGTLDEGVEAVLAGQGGVQGGGEDGGGEDAPVVVGRRELKEVVQIAGLVGAVEVARADVQDAGS